MLEREHDRVAERKKRLCASVVCRVAKHDLHLHKGEAGRDSGALCIVMIFSVRLCFISCYCLRFCLSLCLAVSVFVVKSIVSTPPCFVSVCRFALLVCECWIFFFSI